MWSSKIIIGNCIATHWLLVKTPSATQGWAQGCCSAQAQPRFTI